MSGSPAGIPTSSLQTKLFESGSAEVLDEPHVGFGILGEQQRFVVRRYRKAVCNEARQVSHSDGSQSDRIKELDRTVQLAAMRSGNKVDAVLDWSKSSQQTESIISVSRPPLAGTFQRLVTSSPSFR
jgi:hypothetical protein